MLHPEKPQTDSSRKYKLIWEPLSISLPLADTSNHCVPSSSKQFESLFRKVVGDGVCADEFGDVTSMSLLQDNMPTMDSRTKKTIKYNAILYIKSLFRFSASSCGLFQDLYNRGKVESPGILIVKQSLSIILQIRNIQYYQGHP